MSRLKQGISSACWRRQWSPGARRICKPGGEGGSGGRAAGTLETAAEPGGGVSVYTNETFDKALTDEQTQIIPTADNWSGAVKAEAQDGKLNMVHQGANGGKNEVSYQVNLPFLPGTDKTCAVIPRGKNLCKVWTMS